MKPVFAVVNYYPGEAGAAFLASLVASPLVERVLVVAAPGMEPDVPPGTEVRHGSLYAQETLGPILPGVATPYLLLAPGISHIILEPHGLEAMMAAAKTPGVGLVYADFFEASHQGRSLHPLNPYQPGSVRDTFDFGALMLFPTVALKKAAGLYDLRRSLHHAALYDLRLRLSVNHALLHVAEPLCTIMGVDEPLGDEGLFAYVDSRNRAAQGEMEQVFTDYLLGIGAYVPPETLRTWDGASQGSPFPVEASVVIPVRNREGTIGDAVESACGQETDFPFNVIVVDNHSTDGTTARLARLTTRHRRLCHVVPARRDLAIGGCWNEAIGNDACGRYAVQLDSDDLYEDRHALQRMVDTLRQGSYAMVVGAYTLVDSDLRQIAPGLVDHAEWTEANGHNNALRVNGLGAPRAFATDLVRRLPFPNVSYGEDYRVALRICREYRVGRIFESLYLCRRWQGNTDASLTTTEANRNDAYKDGLRTEEIGARQRMNRESGCSHG